MHKNLEPVTAAKLLKTLRTLEIAGKLIWFSGFGLFAIGFYSAFWSKVPGEVLERGMLPLLRADILLRMQHARRR